MAGAVHREVCPLEGEALPAAEEWLFMRSARDGSCEPANATFNLLNLRFKALVLVTHTEPGWLLVSSGAREETE